MVVIDNTLVIKANQLLSLALQQWRDDKSNEGYEPHFHIKIYKKLSRDEYFDMRRQQAMELLAKQFSNNEIKLFKINNVSKPVNGLSNKVIIKPEMAKRTKYKRVTKRPKTNCILGKVDWKHEPYNLELLSKNMYEVLEQEMVDLEFPSDDLSVSTQIVDDSVIETEIENDIEQTKYTWNAYGKFWSDRRNNDYKSINEDIKIVPPEYKDIQYNRFLYECSQSIMRPIKLGTDKIIKDSSTTFKNNEMVSNSLITLPNCIYENKNKKRLVYITDGYTVSDVKYIYEFEYTELMMIYADSVNIAYDNGIMTLTPKLNFDVYDIILNN